MIDYTNYWIAHNFTITLHLLDLANIDEWDEMNVALREKFYHD